MVAMSLSAVALIPISLSPIGLAVVRRTTDRLNRRNRRNRRCHRPIAWPRSSSTRLHLFRIDARSTARRIIPLASLLPPIKVDIFNVERMYMPREVSQNCKAYVDEDVYSTSCHTGYAERRKNDCEDDEQYDCTSTHDDRGLLLQVR